MKLVMYLSGRTEDAKWHRERDGIAASVNIPVAMAPAMEQALKDFCGLYEESDPGQLPWVATGALDDLFHDIYDNGASDPLYAVAADIKTMCRCEADCGIVHFLKTGRA